MPIKQAMAARYEAGKGVLVLSEAMTDAEISSAVREAMTMSKGSDFTVATHLPKHVEDTLRKAPKS